MASGPGLSVGESGRREVSKVRLKVSDFEGHFGGFWGVALRGPRSETGPGLSVGFGGRREVGRGGLILT